MAYLLLLSAAFFWGAGNVANKTVLIHIGPLSAASLRCLLAAAVLLPPALTERCAPWDRRWARSGLGVSLCFALAITAQQWAYQAATVTNASFLVNTSTVMTPALAWLLLGERQCRSIVLAAGLTLAGAYAMSGPASLSQGMNRGDVACLVSAMFYAGWMVLLGRHAMTHGRPIATTFLHCAVSALLILPVTIAIEAPAYVAITAALPDLLYLGVFSTAVASLLTVIAQRHVAASVAAVLVSAESIFGVLGAALVLHERAPLAGLFGGALILTAILIVARGGHDAVAAAPVRQVEAKAQ